MRTVLTLLSCAALFSAAAPIAAADDHAAEEPTDGHAHAGEMHPLGEVQVGATTFAVSQHGAIEPGEEIVYTLRVSQGPEPVTLRAWIGIRSGRGSMKSRLHKDAEAKVYDAHLAVPPELPEVAQLWLETVDGAGERTRSGLDLPAEDDEHAEHDEEEEGGHEDEHGEEEHEQGEEEDEHGEEQGHAGERE